MNSKIEAAEESVTTQVWRIVKAMGSGAEFGSKQLYLSNSHMPFSSITAALSLLAKRGIIKAVGKGAGKELVWKVTSKGAKIKVTARRRPTPYKRKPKNGVPPIVAQDPIVKTIVDKHYGGEAPALEVGDHVSIGGGAHEITGVGAMQQDGRVMWHGIERPEALQRDVVEQIRRATQPLSGSVRGIIDEILEKMSELDAMTRRPPLTQFSTSELLAELTRRQS